MSEVKERGGFPTRDAAKDYYRRFVVPALKAGYGTPDEYEKAWLDAHPEEKRPATTVGEILQPLLDKRPIHLKDSSYKSAAAVVRVALRHLKPRRPADSVTFMDIEKIVLSPTARGKSPSSDTVRGRYFILRGLFEDAVERGQIGRNPCRGIRMPKPRTGRLRFLTRDECRLLLNACLHYTPRNLLHPSAMFLRAYVATAIYTGIRRAEMQTLEWTDISFETERVTIRRKSHLDWEPKNGKPRSMGINSLLLRILEEYRASRKADLESARQRLEGLLRWNSLSPTDRRETEPPEEIRKYHQAPSMKKLIRDARNLMRGLEEQIASPLVFPSLHGKRTNEVPKGLEEILRSTGLHDSGVTLHTLRHTYASHLVMAGVDLPTVKELMGHGSIATTMRYAHVAPDHATKKGALMPDMV